MVISLPEIPIDAPPASGSLGQRSKIIVHSHARVAKPAKHHLKIEDLGDEEAEEVHGMEDEGDGEDESDEDGEDNGDDGFVTENDVEMENDAPRSADINPFLDLEAEEW